MGDMCARFIYPEKAVIESTKATTNTYTNPLLGIVFWDRYKVAFDVLVRNLDRLNKDNYDMIVEIGTSYGMFLPSLCQIANSVVGTDIEGTLSFCKEKTLLKIKDKYPNLVLKIADATQLSQAVETNSCDAIVAFSVLEHIEQYQGLRGLEQALVEIKKCLKQGGLFICELPVEGALYRMGKRVTTRSQAHPGYEYTRTAQVIETQFVAKNIYNSPFGLPLFRIGIYTAR
jgi:SAM-dependent methyltransferase